MADAEADGRQDSAWRRLARASAALPALGMVLVVALTLVLAAAPAAAHRLNLFAVAEGSAIAGRAYFSGGGVPRDVPVIFHGPDGAVLGETRTGVDGSFRFATRQRVDHRITVDTGDGHIAEFTVHAAELAGAPATQGAALAAISPSPPPSAAAGPEASAPTGAAGAAGLEALVETAVARQLGPLREQLAEFEARTRMADVLAGIGFILGITGTAFFFLGRRR